METNGNKIILGILAIALLFFIGRSLTKKPSRKSPNVARDIGSISCPEAMKIGLEMAKESDNWFIEQSRKKNRISEATLRKLAIPFLASMDLNLLIKARLCALDGCSKGKPDLCEQEKILNSAAGVIKELELNVNPGHKNQAFPAPAGYKALMSDQMGSSECQMAFKRHIRAKGKTPWVGPSKTWFDRNDKLAQACNDEASVAPFCFDYGRPEDCYQVAKIFMLYGNISETKRLLTYACPYLRKQRLPNLELCKNY